MDFKIEKANWSRVKLGDVVIRREENDKERARDRFENFLKVEHLDAESLHVKRWGNHKNEELPPTFYKIFRKGQVLFPTRNPHLRRTALAPFDGICGEKTLTLEPNLELVIPNFIPFLFHSEAFYAHTTTSIIGSTNPHVRWRDVANYEFLLPPKEQQAKLAELLWAMDAVLDKEIGLLKKINYSKQYFFENKVNQLVGKLMPLSKILTIKSKKSAIPHKRIKYIGLEHIISGEFKCYNFSDSSSVLAQCNVIDQGDLCYSKLRPYLDKAFIADFDAISTTELLIYNTKLVSKEYVLYHLHSRPFINFVSGKGFGSKMPRVSHKIIGEYKIKVLEEEKKLISELQCLSKVTEVLESKITASKSLQKSLINQIF